MPSFLLPIAINQISSWYIFASVAQCIGAGQPAGSSSYIQKAWKIAAALLDWGITLVDKARLLAAGAAHAGDWLLAPPITAICLILDDETIRVAVGHQLGANTCEPHTCVSGKTVGTRGLYGLACRKSVGRQKWHVLLNNIIWRSVQIAVVQAIKEPTGLLHFDGKRLDDASLIPWSKGKFLA